MSSIIIISYNTCKFTLSCIRSIQSTYPQGEIIVVDNCSPDDTVVKVRQEFPQVRVIVTPENKSYSNAVNIGMKAATSEFSIVCNADVEFREDSISQLFSFLNDNPTVGVCSPQQEYPDGSWEYCFGHLPSIRGAILDMLMIYPILNWIKKRMYPRFKSWDWSRSVGYCDGAVLAIRRKTFDEVCGFDEEFTFYAEETDFCYRLRVAGWGVYFQPKATVMHIRGASSGDQMNLSEKALRKLVASKVQFMKKHSTVKTTGKYIRFEIMNYTFKAFLCKFLIRIRPSKQLAARCQTFYLLAKFHCEAQ